MLRISAINQFLFFIAILFIPVFSDFYLKSFHPYLGAPSCLFIFMMIPVLMIRTESIEIRVLICYVSVFTLIVCWLISSLVYFDNQFSVNRAVNLLYIFIISLIIYLQCKTVSIEDIERYFLYSFYFVLIVFFFELLSYVKVFDVYSIIDHIFHSTRPNEFYDISKFRSVSEEANYLAMYLLCVIPLILNGRHTIVKVALLGLVCFFSGSRYLYIGIIILFWIYLFPKVGGKFWSLITVVVISLLIYVCNLYFGEVYAILMVDKSLSIRLGITFSEISAFLVSPLYGIGFGGMNNYMVNHSSALANASADFPFYMFISKSSLFSSFNFFSQIMAEMGVFSFPLLCFIFYPVIAMMVRYKNNSSLENRFLLSYIMSIFAMSNFSTVHFYFFSVTMGIVYYLVCTGKGWINA